MTDKTGGPAFPPSNPGYAHGMSIRDYFAAKAMQGLCGSDVWPNDANIPYIAKLSYEMADQMLKAREAK